MVFPENVGWLWSLFNKYFFVKKFEFVIFVFRIFRSIGSDILKEILLTPFISLLISECHECRYRLAKFIKILTNDRVQ